MTFILWLGALIIFLILGTVLNVVFDMMEWKYWFITFGLGLVLSIVTVAIFG
ncbi:hypothetical protein [Bhargavaea cecembensis]|uniref:hypothetical protein n=1 Tax=Bhargavaea cecembensis TaxID=394098 RepID=UPI0015CF1005|nr:hypothetical protein [Bhargavaea cecembensis]